MWADFQVKMKDASFREENFVIEYLALSFHIIELYWFSWETFGDFLIMIHGPSSLFIWRLVDVS